MMTWRTKMVAVLVAMGVAGECDGRSLYVALDGNDSTAEADNPSRPYGTLTNAFRALRNGDRLEVSAGRYEVVPGFPTSYFPMPDYASLRLENLTNVTLAGIGEVEIYGEGPGDFLMIQNCEDVRVENLTFKGNRPSVPEDVPDPLLFSTVLLRGVNNRLHFEKCRFLEFGNHAISHLWGPKRSYNLVVTNCYFADGGDGDGVPFLNEDGAAISGIPSGSRIVNNRIERCFRGIEVEGAFDEFVTNVVIEGNVISECHSVGIMVLATDPVGNNRPEAYSDIRIMNNVITNLYPHPDYTVRTQYGMMVCGGERIEISGNRVENAPRGIGMLIGSPMMTLRNCQVISNEIRNVAGRGIQVWQYYENPVEDIAVEDNYISGAAEEAILINGQRIKCSENTIENSGASGVRGAITLRSVSLGTADVLVADNTVRNVTTNYAHYGIWLDGSTNTTLYGNTFAGVRQVAVKDDADNSRIFSKIKRIEKTSSLMTFTITGKAGENYRFESSDDMATWTLVETNACPEMGTFEVSYPWGPVRVAEEQKYFRIVSAGSGD